MMKRYLGWVEISGGTTPLTLAAVCDIEAGELQIVNGDNIDFKPELADNTESLENGEYIVLNDTMSFAPLLPQ